MDSIRISDITMQSIRELHPRHAGKLVEIHNGIDIERVRRLAAEPTDVHLTSPSLLFIGRLDENKNPVRVVDVLSIVHKKWRIPVHAYFLGYGDLTDETRAHAEELDLASYVHFLGYRENPFPIIRQCDISILLSKAEGFPMCLLESQALGKPVVATVIGGSRILIQDPACGEVIETDEQAADAVQRLLQLDSERIWAACSQSIQRFSLDAYIAKIERMFDETMAGKA